MYFITIKRMLEVCFSAHPNIQYRARKTCANRSQPFLFIRNTETEMIEIPLLGTYA